MSLLAFLYSVPKLVAAPVPAAITPNAVAATVTTPAIASFTALPQFMKLFCERSTLWLVFSVLSRNSSSDRAESDVSSPICLADSPISSKFSPAFLVVSSISFPVCFVSCPLSSMECVALSIASTTVPAFFFASFAIDCRSFFTFLSFSVISISTWLFLLTHSHLLVTFLNILLHLLISQFQGDLFFYALFIHQFISFFQFI